MNDTLSAVANGGFMPHGYCLLWFPDLLWLHVGSDLLIGVAYFTIPVILFYFIRKRRETPFPWLVLLFAAFIFSCGATHLLGALTVWEPLYRLEGYAKLATGLISAITALSLFSVLPRALALRSPRELEIANRALATEVDTRREAERRLAEARDRLEERVAERTASLTESNDRLRAEIHERQRAEAALAAEKERALVTLRSIGDGVIVTDRQGRVELLNPVAGTLTGYSGDSALGRPIAEVLRLLREETRETWYEPLDTYLGGGEAHGEDGLLLLDTRNHREYAVKLQISPIRHPDGGVSGMVVTFSDISEAHRLTREMEFQAHHDPLTELPNRRELEQRLSRLLESLPERPAEHALCYLDLDRFKLVNDTAGHQAGDRLLREIAGLLQDGIRNRDTLARVGGDEFCLLLENCPLERAESLAGELVNRVVGHCFNWQDQEFRVGLSVGLTPLLAGDDRDQLLARADGACYQAKEAGRGRVQISLPGHRDALLARELDPAGLRRLLESDQVMLDCHPIYALDPEAGATYHYSLHPRITTASGALLDHRTLLSTAGHYHLVGELSRRLIQLGLRRAERLLSDGESSWVAIPLNVQALRDRQLPLFLAAQLAAVELEPHQICIAIDEPASVQDYELITGFIRRLQGLGCQFMLNHFGRDLAALNWLARLPVQYLKFDASLAYGLRQPVVLQSVATVVELCRLLDIGTIASGADSSEIVEQLQALDVMFAEGEIFDSPPEDGALPATG